MSGKNAFVVPAGGFIDQVTVADPAAGSEWLFTNAFAGKPDYRLRIMSIRFKYLTILGAVKQPLIQLKNGAVVLAEVFGATVQPAIANFDWTIAPGVSDSLLNNNVTVPWPELLVEPGYTIGTSTVGINAADQYSNITIYFQRWRS